ncbi:MAG: sigma 54-interacting transcriptional regulator, partial [Planctomycetota bacterium]
SNTFERVGGTETIKVDVRVLAATHQNLENLIKEGRFREDLYYRLRVLEITLPPLRDRKPDIPDIVAYLLERHREALVSEAESVSSKALEALVAFDWPGNVRQLENVIRRAMVLCNGSTINLDHLEFGPEPAARPEAQPRPASGRPAEPALAALPLAAEGNLEVLVERLLNSGKANLIEELERLLIGRALEKLNGNQLRTAKLLGITRNTLRSRIAKFGLRPKVKVM